jgi:tetratricopeptide (TPR) repeat protein
VAFTQTREETLNRARAYYKAGRIAEATDVLTTLHEQDPSDARISMLLAECAIRIEHYKPAIQALNSLASSGDPSVLYPLAFALIHDHQIAECRDVINRLLEKSDTPEVRLAVATLEIDARDYDAALANVTRALERNPRLPEAHYWRARVLFESGETTGAEADARSELAISPGNREAQLLLDRILRATKP